MGKITGFLEIEHEDRHYQPVAERLKHYREFLIPLSEKETRDQAARCMDCGIPYCHTGCPVNNQIPDWNDLVYKNDWEKAARNLHSTNNFPEFTGRICPAPCEASCTLNIIDQPVSIKTIECAIIDRAFAEGWVKPEPPASKTKKKVAVVGSGPAGLAAAQQLARAGHEVHLYEKYAKAGGLLRYGIPDFKMEKHHVERRVAQMEAEGVAFHYGAHIGVNEPIEKIVKAHDAVLLSGGAEKGRDLPIPGRKLKGIHFAMDFLPQQNLRVSGEQAEKGEPILATGKHVIVIGGGDTGSDCIGTAARQGALQPHHHRPLHLAAGNFRVPREAGARRRRRNPAHRRDVGAREETTLLRRRFRGPHLRLRFEDRVSFRQRRLCAGARGPRGDFSCRIEIDSRAKMSAQADLHPSLGH